MKKHIKKLGNVISVGFMLAILATTSISLADSPPPIPNTFSGTIKYQDAGGQFDVPAGTLLKANIDNVTKGNTVITTAGRYNVDVSGTNDDDGKKITFIVDNLTAEQDTVFSASAPAPGTLDLVIKLPSSVKFTISGYKINGTNNVNTTLPNWTIVLKTFAGSEITRTTTNNNGFYNFTGLINGTYNVTEVMQNGWGNITAIYLRVDINRDNQTNVNFTNKNITSIETPTGDGGGRGPSGGGGGGGGGGGPSGENYNNIVLIEKYEEIIYKDISTSYRFKNASNPVMFVNITGNVNAGLIETTVEVLKGTSTLVKEAAPGIVYKNINLWVGTSGFATSKNIKEATVVLRVKNSWLDSNVLAGSDIKLVKWEGANWIILETSEKMKDGTYTYFEGKTTSFSPFAITGIKAASVSPSEVTPIQTTPAAAATTSETAPPSNLFIIIGIIAIIAIIVALYLKYK